jgi:alcohol dehydrogenase
MKAVVFDAVNSIRVADVPKPAIQTAKDALIKVTHATICGSDLGIVQGKIAVEKGTVIGHEAVGIVEEVGSDVERVKPGDRVVATYSVQCGLCEDCRNGQVVYCKKGGMFGHGSKWGGYDGTQAEYLRVPYADVVLEPIPPEVSDEQALLVSDNLSTGFMAAQNGGIQPGDVVVVVGAGPVGCCAVAAAQLYGPSMVVSVDMVEYRLQAAKQLGADAAFNASAMDVIKEIRNLTDRKGADVTIEAVGNAKTLEICLESAKEGGHVSIIGVFPQQNIELSMRKILLQGLQIRAGRANMVNMKRLLTLMKRGKLNVGSLISHHIPLSDAVRAYDIFSSRTENVMKIALLP